jgi:hypothetical protein
MTTIVVSIGLAGIRNAALSGTQATGAGAGLAWTAALGSSVVGQVGAAQNLNSNTAINVPNLGNVSVNNGIVGYTATTIGTLAALGQIVATATGIAVSGPLTLIGLGGCGCCNSIQPKCAGNDKRSLQGFNDQVCRGCAGCCL